MALRMLIDAAHPEETRVAVVDGTRLEEFDYESATKKTLKGNIYLAKVTRVEPSLQAAFVDYGGNRHGFLPFSEIHPDYYQIPVADRQALLARQRAEEDAAGDREHTERPGGAHAEDGERHDPNHDTGDHAEQAPPEEAGGAQPELGEGGENGEAGGGETVQANEFGEPGGGEPAPAAEQDAASHAKPEAAHADVVTVGGDAFDEVSRRRVPNFRNYKIQEVIKRRQIVLVQVVKEERGTKGAALTTYMSLAGRYCVLMPNTARGVGVSLRIAAQSERRRLRSVVDDLEVPEGMGLIVRTAGMERTKSEIKRDCEFLLRTWDDIRERTLKATAPALVYEDANLIKRAIRDTYRREIEEVIVEGDEGYRNAKMYMKMLMPSHAKRVQHYVEQVPLFQRNQIESQLDSMYSPTVGLRSGGSIVISPTEALVAIDVNSGKSTRERHIEETASKTNLEAAEEIARQLRLRDLAGLIVVDFIDMESGSNARNVERRLKESLKADRARIQLGKISAFGLLEMSRQRLRPSLLESSTLMCGHCHGRGYVRSVESTTLHVLRAIEDEGMRDRADEITVHVASDVAMYLLNQKRQGLAEIEKRYNLRLIILGDDSLVSPNYRLDRTKPREPGTVARTYKPEVRAPEPIDIDEVVEAEEPEEEAPEAAVAEGAGESEAPRPAPEEGEREPRRSRRTRGRRRGRSGADRQRGGERPQGGEESPHAHHAAEVETPAPGAPPAEAAPDADMAGTEAIPGAPGGAPTDDDGQRKRRRRGRRGGRRRRRGQERPGEGAAAQAGEAPAAGEHEYGGADEGAPAGDSADRMVLAQSPATALGDDYAETSDYDEVSGNVSESADAPPPMEHEPYAAPEPPPAPAAANEDQRQTPAGQDAEPPLATPPVYKHVGEAPVEAEKPRKRGWWSR
jgi:ribonuclease E